MTIEELLELSVEEIKSFDDAKLLEILGPYIENSKPKTVVFKEPKKKTKKQDLASNILELEKILKQKLNKN